MNRAAKAESLTQLKEIFAGAGVVVIARYAGLSVSEMSELRKRLKAERAHLRVVKNRLARMALSGSVVEGAQEMFRGPVAIAWSPDMVSAPKIAVKFSSDNENFGVIGGFMGEEVLDSVRIQALASLPSLEELRGRMAGLIQAPATKVAGVLQAPAGQMARLLSAYASKVS